MEFKGIYYEIKKTDNTEIKRDELVQILGKLPLSNLEIINEESNKKDKPILLVNQDVRVISLRPKKGRRICQLWFSQPEAEYFHPGRVMDELSRRGTCCSSYHTDPRDLGLNFDWNLGITLDIYKTGW